MFCRRTDPDNQIRTDGSMPLPPYDLIFHEIVANKNLTNLIHALSYRKRARLSIEDMVQRPDNRPLCLEAFNLIYEQPRNLAD